MKHSILFLILFATFIGNAQTPSFITESDLLAPVRMSARGNLGDDAILTGIVFVPYTLGDKEVSMSSENGTAQSWIYRFYSASSSRSMHFRVYRETGGPVNIIHPGEAGITLPRCEVEECNLEVPSTVTAGIALYTAEHSGLSDWIAKNPMAKITFASLFNNSCVASGKVRGQYWRFDFSDGSEVYRCYVDATTNTQFQAEVLTSIGLVPRADQLIIEAYPNPIRADRTSSISCDLILSASANIRVTLRDLLGRDAAPVVSAGLPSGRHSIILSPTRMLSPGTYVLSAESADYRVSKSLAVE